VTLASSIMSNIDSTSYRTQSISNVSSLMPSDVATYNTSHQAWWDAFHRKSYVEIPDKIIEKEYYASLYLLASASRAGETPPGLWGNWVTTDPAWNGDYTLNYNYETAFYSTFPTNHLQQSENYDAPVIAWMPNAQAEATANGWLGAFYRVHIGPQPNGSADQGATVTEMLLQSFQGTMRLFADWASGMDAKFANLRAYGGFLVASQMSPGNVPYVAITSELGNAFTLLNPWGGGQVAGYRNGASASETSESTLTLQTCPGEMVVLAPSGTSYASVVALMNSQ
jgi:hypothetical protein